MPKKTSRKKKAFKAACRDMAMKGMMNTPDGSFKSFSQCQDNAMVDHYKGGYKIPK